jgi:hypothetical protein
LISLRKKGWMTDGPSAKWNIAGTRMPSMKNPVLPGLAPRMA